MAKESMKAREVKRAKLVAKYAAKRAALKKIVNTGEPAEAFEAAQKLQALPKNSNPIRMHNRCSLTGRPKGYIRQFGKKSFTCGHNNPQFLFNILSNAYSQHCTTSWLNEISFLSASVCSFSISSSGIRIVLFDFCWFLISNILITSALIILVQKSLEIYK